MPKAKQQKESKARVTASTKTSRRAGYQHGTTYCRYCFAKIARGMTYCNDEHKRAYANFKSSSVKV